MLGMSIKRNEMKAALLFAPKNDVRRYLCGVRFNGDAGTLEATDGHRAIMVHTNLRWEGVCITIPHHIVEMAVKAKDDYVQLLKDDDGVWHFGGTPFLPIDDAFPDMSRILPPQREIDAAVPSSGIYQPRYLVDASKAIGLLYKEKTDGSTGVPMKMMKDKPEHTGFVIMEKCTILIMPLRC